MDIEKAEEALKGLGVGFDEFRDGRRRMFASHRWVTVEEAVREPSAESVLRSAVLSVAPGSYLRPLRGTVMATAPTSVQAYLLSESGALLLPQAVFGATYAEAWINAAIALHEAGHIYVGRGGE